MGRKLLDMSANEATSEHRVTESHEPIVDGGEVIARLPGHLGSFVRVEPGSSTGRHASLEDVVMGYLSMDRVNRPRERTRVAVAE